MKLRVGTDCSGIEAPIQALRNLKIPFQHVFACEKDKFARESILANYKPDILYEDITSRNHAELPDIDLYVCGFPCQSFSLAGKQQGMNDPRGLIMNHCIDVIKYKQPTFFILENVKNFKHIDTGTPFNYLMKKLEDLKTYNIYHDIYNTKDYGIPQNRERIYIIGVLKSKQKKEYEKPKVIKCKPIKDFILDTTVYDRDYPNYIKKRLEIVKERLDTSKYIHILSCAKNGFLLSNLNIIPSLTTSSLLYILNYKRCMSSTEALLFQGFPKTFKQVVSNHQLHKQAGNAMSVNVIQNILKNLFTTI
jgi:DNA (cytosine-5)-methyltransferase 1